MFQQSDLNEVLKLINKKLGNDIQSVDYFEKKYSFVLLMNLISVVFIDIRIILNLVFKTAIISATLKCF